MLKSIEQRFWNLLKSFSPRLHEVLFKKRKGIVYILSGGTAAFVELGSLYLFKGVFGLHLLLAVSLAFMLAFCVSFVLQKFWTFEDRSTAEVHSQAVKYFMITGFNFFLNLFLMHVLVEVLHVWYMLAKFLISGGIALFSFFVYRAFVFKGENQSDVFSNSNVKSFISRNQLFIAIFSLALVLRLFLFFINLNANGGNFIDTIRAQDGYYEISKNLIAGNGYSDDPGPVIYRPNALRPPAWIITIALIAGAFGSYVPVFIFEIILASLIPILGMKLASRIVGKESVFLVGLFLACEPYSILNSFLLASETSFTFVLLVFALFLFKYFENQNTRNAVWSGVFLALAMLIKPTVQFLPILVPVGFYLLNRTKLNSNHLKHGLYFLIVCGLVLMPWGYRNYKEFGKFGISSQAGFNLYTVLVPTVMAIENGTTYEAERGQAKFENGMTGTDITPSNDKIFAKKAVGILMNHKLALAKSVGISVITFMTHDGMLTVLGYSHVIIPNLLDKPAITLLTTEPVRFTGLILKYLVTPGALILLMRVVWILVFLFFLFGAFMYFKKEKFSQLALFSLLLVLYFALITTVNGFGMNARFRMPVNTFILIFSMHGLFLVWRKIVNKVKSRNA